MQNIIIRRARKSRFAITLCGLGLAISVLTLGGCGKKPSSVDPPPWVEDDTFPATYPNPNLDPKPTVPPDTMKPVGQK